MPQASLNDDLYTRVVEFKQVVETVLEQEISFDDSLAAIIAHGLDGMLADILGHIDQPTLVASFQQLAAQYPAQVYGYVAETLRRGAAVQEREGLKRKFGFYQPLRPLDKRAG